MEGEGDWIKSRQPSTIFFALNNNILEDNSCESKNIPSEIILTHCALHSQLMASIYTYVRSFTLKIQPPLLRQPNLLHSQTGCRIVMRSACTLKTQPPLLGTQLTNTHKHISGSINSASQKQHKLLQ